MANAPVCYKCKERFLGNPYKRDGKTYCFACFQKLQEEVQKAVEEKEGLYALVRDIFNVSELPQETTRLIDKEIQTGKTIKGLMATLNYYYRIQGNVPGAIEYVGLILRDHYNEAKAYYEQCKKISQHNAEIDLNIPVQVITVKRKNLATKKKKLTDISSL